MRNHFAKVRTSNESRATGLALQVTRFNTYGSTHDGGVMYKSASIALSRGRIVLSAVLPKAIKYLP